MAIKIDGDINQYINLVGRSDEDVKIEAQQIANKLKCAPTVYEFDQDFIGYDTTKSGWLLYAVGVEFKWLDGQLEAVMLYTKDYTPSGFKAYPARLFKDFSNTATHDEIIRHLGTPDNEADQNVTWVRSAWIRYDEENGNWVHFEFDGDMHLKMVTICTP